jgi:hypothetical protein
LQVVPESQYRLGSVLRLVKSEHLFCSASIHDVAMKVTEKETLTVRCPTCGAKRGEKCELATGQPRTEPHRDRRLAAAEK